MGVVYVGRHETLGNRVVVKLLRPELSSNVDVVRRFFNEAQAATAIRNPGIVQVFDFGTTPDGRAYIAMELLEGENLAARITQRRHDPAGVYRLGRQVANALQAAHAAGITHRDLKPENLFLVPDSEVIGGERVKVLDFGIAKLTGEAHPSGVKTRTGMMMGTPSYMSPEQCRSASSADARSDIYALGCILFEMTCGRPPFIRGGLGDIVAAHLHEPPPSAQSLAPDIPVGLSALIANMLAKRPDARPQTMTAVSQILDEILRSIGGPSPRTPPFMQSPTSFPVPSPASPFPHIPMPPPISSPLLAANAQPLLTANALVPASVQVYPDSTTLRSSAGVVFSRPSAAARRVPFVLGGLVIVGAVAAIAIVLAARNPSSEDRAVSHEQVADLHGPADAAAPADGLVTPLLAPDATPTITTISDAAQKTPHPMTADDLEAECQGYAAGRKWDELAQCADRLKPLDLKRAAELKNHAVEEARSAPRIAGVAAALQDKNLKRAKSELDQVWPQSIEYPAIKGAYDIAEAQAIAGLAAQLDRVKHADCEEYNQLLSKERATNPPRVAAEAARRIPWVPPVKCDVDALSNKGTQQFAQSQFAESLASFEAAYACRPGPALILKSFVVACNLRNVAKTRAYWKRLPTESRTQAIGTCVRNGITEEILSAP